MRGWAAECRGVWPLPVECVAQATSVKSSAGGADLRGGTLLAALSDAEPTDASEAGAEKGEVKGEEEAGSVSEPTVASETDAAVADTSDASATEMQPPAVSADATEVAAQPSGDEADAPAPGIVSPAGHMPGIAFEPATN